MSSGKIVADMIGEASEARPGAEAVSGAALASAAAR
jgi:hypothetical protein